MKITKGEKFKEKKIGGFDFVNINCWLVKTLGYPSAERCRYCESKFRYCLFFQYLIISLTLVFILFALFFLIEGGISKLEIFSVFVLVFIYGFFFNQSTEKIIKANFAQRKAKDDLEELARSLEGQVERKTKDLKARAEHLKKLLIMRSEFLDIASHQLKTPVSVILGIASMFKEGSMDKLPKEQQLKFVENIFHKAKKLSTIINDILRASEMDTDEFKISKSAIKATQIKEIIETVCQELKPVAEEKRLKLEYQKPKRLTSRIMSSVDFLEQAIYNLVDNAIKYTASGFVRISLSEDDKRIIIKVADSGIGIPEADQNKIFDKFARAKNAVNMYTDGSGLGVFIVKKIVEAHQGGRISFTSEEGKGTTFTITIPVIKQGG